MSESFKSEFKNSFWFLIKLFFLFMLLIFVFRTVFIVYYFDKMQVAAEPLSEIFLVYFHAISLDIATASILITIPWLLILINTLFKSKIIKTLIFIYTFIAISLSSFIYIAELGIYNEWEEKPTFKIFSYLKHPDEAINSNPLIYTIILTVILIVVLTLFYKLTKKLFNTYKLSKPRNFIVIAFFFLLMPWFVFLGARGGWKPIPISQSSVYFSAHKVYNDAAISTVYNFVHSITENQSILDGKNRYLTSVAIEDKRLILQEFMATDANCSSKKILTVAKPNVVLVIWESLAGDFIDDEEYQKTIPNIMKMAKEGVLFTKAYASGTLSHEGMPSIFSGRPALYDTYITNLPSKFNKLPNLTQSLNKNGYTSMFLFGGQLRYGNLTSYMYSNHFDIIKEGTDIDLDTKEGNLGIHDGFMLQHFVKKTTELKEPFFSSMFTLSSHSPYDQPMKDVFEWGEGDKDYINSIYYTDKSIGEFIESAKKEPWYKNTLFIFTADHSHRTPKSWSRADSRWHHIPILFYGDVIKEEYRGVNFEKIVSQHDIAATLLSQLDIKHEHFIWSRDIFCDEYRENAYIMVQNGFGLVTNSGSLSYDLKDKRILFQDANISSLKTKGNVYMEKLLQTYLDY